VSLPLTLLKVQKKGQRIKLSMNDKDEDSDGDHDQGDSQDNFHVVQNISLL
jgi:hypothetical protein